MRTERILLLSLSMVLATGCAAYRAKPISPNQTAAAFEARSLKYPGLKEFLEANLPNEIASWPPKKWNLTMLTLAAFYYNPDLDVARAKWGVAKAHIKAAAAIPNPTFSTSPQYVSNANIGSVPWVLPFALNIPVETAGKRGYRIAQAKNLSEAARLNIATAAWEVRSRLRKNFLDLYAAKKSAEILEKEFTLQQENLKLMEERASADVLSPFVLNEARLGLYRTRFSLNQARKQEAQARVRVADSLGVTVRSLEGVDFIFGSFGRPPEKLFPGEVRREALLGRPDILASLAKYAAAESALRIEIARQYPDVNIGPGYEFDQSQNKWGLGLFITLPIFNQNKGAIAEAEARRTEAEANFNALQTKAIAEIDEAQAGYRAALKKFKAAEMLLTSQKERQHLLETSSGEVRRVALLQTRIEYDAVAIEALTALVDAQKSLGLLEDAVQRPLDENAGPLSSQEKNPRSEEEN